MKILRNGKKLLPLLLLPLLLTACGKTVYLVSEEVDENGNVKTETYYSYDEQGRLTEYEQEVRNDYYEERVRTTTSYVYTYDEAGNITEAEVELGDADGTLKYTYDNDGFLKSVKCGGQRVNVECDENGRIVEVEGIDADVSVRGEYSYYPGGALKKVKISREADSFQWERISEFNEQGRTLTERVKLNGEKRSTGEYEYDENGRTVYQVQTIYDDGDRVGTYEYFYTYDEDGMIASMTLEVRMEDGRATLEYEGKRDGRTVELALDNYTARFEDEADEALPEEYKEAVLSFVYDENGCLVEREIPMMSQQRQTEHVELKVGKNYRKANLDDPVYMMFFAEFLVQ